ncbi:Os06g0186600 [Oryza sativa Japonica Group]|uniref:Os06g0186600 protein n=1 Tax=Oryza sativa subsp. japonica TaxID=39947 RepID=A0A0N7KLN6_ORYSJ|nr:Os06g0186600 [Oryza sativa Japonica Group]
MVQLPSSGKRPAEPAMAAASAAGATVKLEADEMLHGGEEDGGPLSKRAKAGVQMPAPPPPPPPPQQQVDPGGGGGVSCSRIPFGGF